MFAAKFFRKEHKLGSYKGKIILEAKRTLLIFSLDVCLPCGSGRQKDIIGIFCYHPKGHLQAFKRVLENEVLCQLLCQTCCTYLQLSKISLLI